MDSPQSTFGNYKCLEPLFSEFGEDRKKQKTASSLIHRYYTRFKAIKKCNLRRDVKEGVMLDLLHHFKTSVFKDISRLDENEKRWLYNFIITKWRRE